MENLKKYKTCELINELRGREGVKEIVAEPHEIKEVAVDGPAVLLVIID